MVLWRSDYQGLEPFAAFEGQGYVSFDADKTVDFYVGNTAVCDPRLTISMVIWDSKTAWFRIHNPTDQDIKSLFITAKAVKNHLQINQAITVPSGSSIRVKVPDVE